MAILIIDDVPVTRKILESFLKDGGYADIIQAESAEHGFKILGLYADRDADRPDIDLILMDIVLQGVDGKHDHLGRQSPLHGQKPWEKPGGALQIPRILMPEC